MAEVKTAWELIGFYGQVKVKGGRTVYESVDYRDDTPGTKVRLARLGENLRQINRWVDPDTELEVIEVWD